MNSTFLGDASWTFLVPLFFVAGAWAIVMWALQFPTDHGALLHRLMSAPKDGRAKRCDGTEEQRAHSVIRNPDIHS
ncbi:hypothetical protein [Hyphomicrobium sp.]|uniref:hypothetical protein n=1 Tax=Hyphomicrobium sp. TaxID=82 RepID=UPI001D7D1B4C|nr:hypothetical protein [Hyphomicrobium sp.]MBY0562492.1 hypothetical protein [Hyphomicrobium sp.]